MTGIKNLSRAGWLVIGTVLTLTLTLATPGLATATIVQPGVGSGSQQPEAAAVPSSPSFFNSSFQVVPGSLVSLHWGSGSGNLESDLHYLLTSSLPGFSSGSVTTWPPGTSPAPTSNGTGWTTNARAVTVAVPKDATAGTSYTVSIATCDSTECSPANRAVLTVPSSPTSWVTQNFRSAYPQVTTFVTPGQPFATTFLTTDNSIWTDSEFSYDVAEIKNNGKRATVFKVDIPKGSSSLFQEPFANCGTSPCQRSAISALGEQVITAGGMIWLTFGGWRWDRASEPPNHSEVVGFDPTTKKFCTYLLPGDNNEIAGIASTGTGKDRRIWVVESRGSGNDASLDGFDPSTIGSGCDGQANEAYVLPASVRLLTWPRSGGLWPAQIAVDPTSASLWITDFDGYPSDGTTYSDIDQVNISDPQKPTFESRYSIPSGNTASFLGAKPWEITAPPDSDYVYAVDNGDAEVVRIDKSTKQVDELAIPLTSDVENGFGLAIASGRLYFTLANDALTDFGEASTFGYVNLSSWPLGSSHADGVLYSGLPQVADPGAKADYRAIAVGPTGQVAITDKHGMIRLTPAK